MVVQAPIAEALIFLLAIQKVRKQHPVVCQEMGGTNFKTALYAAFNAAQLDS